MSENKESTTPTKLVPPVDDDEEEEEEKYVPYPSREEWKDITGVSQDDGPQGGICSIAYTNQFRETMDYFRAIVRKDERSQRALDLTADVIKLNAANYTAWYYRRLILEALDVKDFKSEMEWTAKIGTANPKNYQIWYHRRALVEKSRDPSLELDFTVKMLIEDSKNYHAWAHRQWILEEFNLWEGELEFIDHMLLNDLRNNSAWNQRHFVLSKTKDLHSLDLIKEEIQYALKYIKKAPNNQSPWSYLKGFFKGSRFDTVPSLKETCFEFSKSYPTCAHAVSLLVDIYEEEASKESLGLALECCEKLEKTLAPIQSKYWIYRASLLREKLAQLS